MSNCKARAAERLLFLKKKPEISFKSPKIHHFKECTSVFFGILTPSHNHHCSPGRCHPVPNKSRCGHEFPPLPPRPAPRSHYSALRSGWTCPSRTAHVRGATQPWPLLPASSQRALLWLPLAGVRGGVPFLSAAAEYSISRVIVLERFRVLVLASQILNIFNDQDYPFINICDC